MKDIRITFRDEDFSAVSRSLVDLGVVFHVEPMVGGLSPTIHDVRTERGSTAARPGQAKKRQAKAVARTVAGPSGAGRLREMAERNRVAAGGREEGAEGKAHAPGIPDDLSAKLLPYGERQEG